MMETRLHLKILPQPDDNTCGPTCLQAVYQYYGDDITLEQVIDEVASLEDGGTLAVMLGCHALSRGYRTTIYTFDLQVFDPTWFQHSGVDMARCLQRQLAVKTSPKLHTATHAYLEFLQRGGRIRFEDLSASLIRNLLKRAHPILTGLSATFLYRTARELVVDNELRYDDIQGEPTGHFVVLCGYDMVSRQALVADPLHPNPLSRAQVYAVNLNRLTLAIMLGSITFDANLLVISQRPQRSKRR